VGRLFWDGARRDVLVAVTEPLSKGDNDRDRNDSVDNWNLFPPGLVPVVLLDDLSGLALLMYCFRYRCVPSGTVVSLFVSAPSNEGGF
jgi:hypothetical protein